MIDSSEKTVIGIGDLHGHHLALERILGRLSEDFDVFQNASKMKLRDEVSMTFLGDYIDREDDGLEVIGSVRNLESMNPGIVVPLLGNHEQMALNDFKYIEKLAGKENPNLRYYKYNKDHGMNGGREFILEFGDTEGEAIRNYVKRMSSESSLGSWMRNLKPVNFESINGKEILFVHAGIPESILDRESLDSYLEEEEYLDYSVPDDESILWERSIRRMTNLRARKRAENLGVDYIVHGHEPREGILCFGNSVFDIDVGMCPYFGENDPAAIVFKKDGIYECYAEKGSELIVPI